MTRVEVKYHDGDVETLHFGSAVAANTFVRSVSKNPDVAEVKACEVKNG